MKKYINLNDTKHCECGYEIGYSVRPWRRNTHEIDIRGYKLVLLDRLRQILFYIVLSRPLQCHEAQPLSQTPDLLAHKLTKIHLLRTRSCAVRYREVNSTIVANESLLGFSNELNAASGVVEELEAALNILNGDLV